LLISEHSLFLNGFSIIYWVNLSLYRKKYKKIGFLGHYQPKVEKNNLSLIDEFNFLWQNRVIKKTF